MKTAKESVYLKIDKYILSVLKNTEKEVSKNIKNRDSVTCGKICRSLTYMHFEFQRQRRDGTGKKL